MFMPLIYSLFEMNILICEFQHDFYILIFLLYFSLSSVSALTVLFCKWLICGTDKGPMGKVELNYSANAFRIKQYFAYSLPRITKSKFISWRKTFSKPVISFKEISLITCGKCTFSKLSSSHIFDARISDINVTLFQFEKFIRSPLFVKNLSI